MGSIAILSIELRFVKLVTLVMTSTQSPTTDPARAVSWQIELLYDGACPLCVREVNFLKTKDADRGLVSFVDIDRADYDPAAHAGISFETAMGRIHAILPDGTIVKNVEVFRRIYEILGIGWVYAITRIPAIEYIANLLYGIWADLRLRLTGRPNLDTVVASRQQHLDNCNTDRCQTSNQ
jgi:predicted DCC family thiol-disulfide oxidoreductase YuxK